MWMSNLSGVVPQISVVAGTCPGTAAMLAESADFVVVTQDSEIFAASNSDVKIQQKTLLKTERQLSLQKMIMKLLKLLRISF